ncbi:MULTISPECIES: glycoside hydrolase family 6 protein [Streptomycetaceae]|uniref:glycoside hydrolase family 6 protein n=1 Tax=Streptomycetaceae TaxID=2062 RepID=UPI000213DC5E|nr:MULTISPECIES: glycoside hydrolase family 6 protein [Streptomycetaceae]MYS58923.1 endoglucanase [Streptomyces sp. SID5468]CCB74622.1 Secreted endoglucanase [Streptantibioticus cattleyicolor NRRL 8057 = DSM 46488]
MSAHPARPGALAAALVGVALLVAGCSSPGRAPRTETSHAAPALPGAPFWADPDSAAVQQREQWRADGHDADAALLDRIARQPAGKWIGGDDPEGQAARYTRQAAAAGRRALLVAYDIPHRDCGQFSGGGAPDGTAYRSWVDRLAAGIGPRPATVVLEPDAVAHMVDGCTPPRYQDERYALLAYAVGRLTSLPATAVYLDAGNSGWITDPLRMAGPLRRAGVDRAAGFALNTSNFQTTRASTAYGLRLSEALGGKHFVIDTSRNGNGPLAGRDPQQGWCNPPGRALGTPPTTRTGRKLLDAYLWVKPPGESDGPCNGGPPAGQWWPEYALDLARNAR